MIVVVLSLDSCGKRAKVNLELDEFYYNDEGYDEDPHYHVPKKQHYYHHIIIIIIKQLQLPQPLLQQLLHLMIVRDEFELSSFNQNLI